MDRREALKVRDRCETAHLALAVAGRLMRHFDAIVRIRGCAVQDRRAQGTAGGLIARQLVGDQAARDGALCCVKSLRKNRIAARRFRRGCTRMSITSPSSSTARHKSCVRPCIRTNSSSRYHVSPWRPRRRRRRAYSSPNVRHHWRIVSYVTVMPTLGEEVLDVPNTEAESVVQPHRVTDDFRRESVSSVARHTATVPRRHSS